MPRRNSVKKRQIDGDQRFGNTVVAKFMNCLMYCGKKTVAESIVYATLDNIKEKLGTDSINAFSQALENVKPAMEVRSRRVGGATYQVPTIVNPMRAQALAIRWVINSARSRNEKGMQNKLAAEILDAYNNKGGAVKKKEDTHKMAEANRAFAHYSW